MRVIHHGNACFSSLRPSNGLRQVMKRPLSLSPASESDQWFKCDEQPTMNTMDRPMLAKSSHKLHVDNA